MEILISGASVAGPALAHWLQRYGHRVTVVERAPALRGGGYAVDFRGAVHLQTLARMGLLEALQERATHMGDIDILDATGAKVAALPSAVFSGDLEILRGDLAEVLHAATREHTQYRFGDWITAVEQDADGVDVTFRHAAPRRFDLLVGADGVHSGVRRLVFGEQPGIQRPLGVYGAIFTMPNTFGLLRTGLMYSEPRRCVTVGSPHGTEAIVSLMFTDPPSTDIPRETGAQRELVRRKFAGAGWRVPELLEAMDSAADFWFDETMQVHLGRWSHGRVVLLGDAAYAGGPGGNGTGLAVVGAHVLAAELAAAPYDVAFQRYERLMRPYVTTCQKQASGSPDFLVPPTAKKIAQRNRFFRMLRYLPVKGLVKRLATKAATAIDLPDYPRGGLDHKVGTSGNMGHGL